jgi:4-hydroxy-4-methyl-2-oxoglutarate aldolase
MAVESTAPDAWADRLEQLYAPAILDVMEERGMWQQALPPGLVALDPSRCVAGPAFPYRYLPTEIRDRDVILSEILEAYEQAPAGSVLLANAGAEPPFAAHFGELSANSCKVSGVRGAVVDGGLRDGALVAATGFPVWYRYRTPVDVVGRYRITAVGEPVEIGGVRVMFGDYLVADIDGVIVVPRDRLAEIVEAAEQCCAEEASIRERLVRRESALALFKEAGRF